MATLNIGGQRVTVGDEFLNLSPEEQNATVDEIAASLTGQGGDPNQRVGAAFDALPDTAEKDTFQSMNILPARKNLRTGEGEFDINSGISGAIIRAVMAPGQAMSGELPIRDPSGRITNEAIGRATEAAGVGGAPMAAGGSIARQAPRAARTATAVPDRQLLLQAAERQDVQLPRGVASDIPGIQQIGKTSTTIPVAGLPLRNASRRSIGQLGEAADKVQSDIGTGDVALAGDTARRDIGTFITDTIGKQITDRYNAVDALVDDTITRPLSATAKTVGDIQAKRGAAAIPGEGQAVAQVTDALSRPEGLTYQGIKNLRTSVRELLDNPSALPARNISQGELKRIYSSLTDDLRKTVKAAGGVPALRAFEKANTFNAKKAAQREALNKIIKPEADEKVFDKIVSMGSSKSRADIKGLQRAKRAVSPETWNEISSAVISRLGRDAEGNFTPDRFITAYGGLSPAGKRALFGTTGKGTLQALDDIARISSRFKRLNEFANPSGTSQGVLTGLGAGFAIPEPTTVLGALATGGAVSLLLSKPVAAKQVATWAKAYEKAARSPTRQNLNALRQRSVPLALIIEKDMGVPGFAREFPANVNSIIDAAAQNGEGEGFPPEQINQNGQGQRILQRLEA